MNRPPTKKRNVIAGGLVLAALGVFLMFKGPGFGGGGSGEGDGNDSDPSEAEANLQSSQTNVPEANDAQDVVDILIDGDTYLVGRSDGSRRAASLDQLKTLIADAPGNADGIQVRIAKKASSLLQAERDLDALLESTGIDNSAVRRVPDPVD